MEKAIFRLPAQIENTLCRDGTAEDCSKLGILVHVYLFSQPLKNMENLHGVLDEFFARKAYVDDADLKQCTHQANALVMSLDTKITNFASIQLSNSQRGRCSGVLLERRFSEKIP